MKPEQGNPDILVDEDVVRESFCRSGVVPGDTVILHGSLSSMGWVKGGPRTVFDGILAAASPGGTVAMPTLWYNGTPERRHPEQFDLRESPAYNGALADGMRKDLRSYRSHHFSHSISAIGSRAEELTSGHDRCGPAPSPWNDTAFGVNSPWQRLYEWNALYSFIGVDFTVCTMKHYIESQFVVRLLALLPSDKERAVKRDELGKDCNTNPWPYSSGSHIEEVLVQHGVLKKTKLGSATLRTVRTRPLVELFGREIWEHPEAYFSAEFLEWREHVFQASARASSSLSEST